MLTAVLLACLCPALAQNSGSISGEVKVLALFLCTPVVAADWPQFLGPGRNGVYAGPPLSETWAATGPRVVWRRQIGQGLSGPVVAQNRVILFHRVANREVVEAIRRRHRQDAVAVRVSDLLPG